jgi:hypothetical protein
MALMNSMESIVEHILTVPVPALDTFYTPTWFMLISCSLLIPISFALKSRPLLLAKATILGICILGLLSLTWLSSTAILYVLAGSYVDHAEPVIASLSWVYLTGSQPLYHALDAPDRYSLSYGPMVYIINAVAMWLLGASIATSKLMGVVACLSSIGIIFFTIRRLSSSAASAIITGILVTQLLLFYNYSYWNRPDPFLILCVSIGLLAVTRASTLAGGLWLGLMAGVAINLKIHGILYMLPVVVLFLLAKPNLHTLGGSLIVWFVTVSIPFLLPQISISDYFKSLNAAIRHGFDPNTLFRSLLYLIPFLAPMLAAKLLSSNTRQPFSNTIFCFSILATALIVLILSSKPGAGPHYFLPLLPSVALGSALLIRRSSTSRAKTAEHWNSKIGLILLTSSVLALLPSAILSQARVAHYFFNNSHHKGQEQEIAELLKANEGRSIQMGYSEHSVYQNTFSRPLIVFAGNTYFFDAVALMDYDAAGVKMPQSTIDELHRCRIHKWLIPQGGAPFNMRNWYPTGRNIFGDDFQSSFLATYEQVSSGEYFDLWTCRQLGP